MNNRIKRVFLATLVLMALTLVMVPSLPAGAVRAAEQPYVFTTVDFPGAVYTQANGINAGGDIVGLYVDINSKWHGFLFSGGVFSTIDFPDNIQGAIRSTQATGIGPSGDIVGQYQLYSESVKVTHGYLLTKKGEWILVDYPGNHDMTGPFRILPDGTIVGCCHDDPLPLGMHGFVIGPKGMNLFSLPGSMHMGATPNGKTLVGYQQTTATTARGYLLDDGNFIPFDFPGSTFTLAMDINPARVTVGAYMASGIYHGFLVETRGSAVEDWQFTTIDYPSATQTRVRGINAGGDMVGNYIDSAAKTHGFLASRTQREKELREALDLGKRVKSGQVYVDENVDLTEYFKSLADIQAKYDSLRQ